MFFVFSDILTSRLIHEMWKVPLAKEIKVIQHSILGMDDDGDLPGFTQDELSEIRDYVANC
jgi:hypothetical protein